MTNPLIYPLFICSLILMSVGKSCSKESDSPEPESSNSITVNSVARTSVNITAIISLGKIDKRRTVYSAGICYGVDLKPTFERDKVYPINLSLLSSNEKQTVEIPRLQPGTLYYARPYVQDDSEIWYGESVTFTTLSNGPASGIKIVEVSNSRSTINLYSNQWNTRFKVSITDDGGNPITAKGYCYSTTQKEPTLENSKVIRVGEGKDSFERGMSMDPDHVNYIRAFAYNSAGTSYSNTIEVINPLEVGYPHKGGVIAYIFKPGEKGYKAGETHGLLVSLSMKSVGTSLHWGADYCENYSVSTSTLLGDGYANTIKIVNANPYLPTQQCGLSVFKSALEHKSYGHGGWFIPSWEEVEKIQKNYYLTSWVKSTLLGTSSMASKDKMYVFSREWPSSKIEVSKKNDPPVSYISYF